MKCKIVSYLIDTAREEGLDKVTENGEVCYDYKTKEFVVYEETYAYEVGRTAYPLCAYYMLQVYADNYL